MMVIGAAVTGLAANPTGDTLAIFVQPGASDLARRFEREALTSITAQAGKLGVEVRVLDARKGAPSEVTVTPLLVFQNHRGRSIFQGRYEDVGKVTHFLRTSRFVPQQSAPTIREDVGLRQVGRARVAAKLKVTGLTGSLPAGFDAPTFESEARGAILGAMTGYRRETTAALGRSDRTFYLDFHPYRSADGMLFVSTEVYSQFNCHAPVYSGLREPVNGLASDPDKVFAAAGVRLAKVVDDTIRTSPAGDGFDPVPAEAPVVSWEQIGLQLPPAPSGSAASIPTNAKLASAWTIEQVPDPPVPILQFKFPAPLDNYSGVAREVSGDLTLGEDFAMKGATGRVRVATRSLTMGEPGLDDTVMKNVAAAAFPESVFELASVAGDDGPLVMGKTSQVLAKGAFTMKGIRVPLDVRAEIEPIVAADGGVRLSVTASFSIRLKDPFQIDGPDGPSPARDTLEFFLQFTMVPKTG